LEELCELAESLQKRLDELSRHCSYGFFNKDRQLFYAGQTTDLDVRVSDHMEEVGDGFDESKVRNLCLSGVFNILLFAGD
jgi:hypothetical protein